MESKGSNSQSTDLNEKWDGPGIGAKTLSNVESNVPQHISYPKRVFFIISNEFCERFNFYGMKAILVLYLKNQLGFAPKDATILYHTFEVMVYFMCIFGGILSDVWLGKFRTILYLSLVYGVGSTVVSISSIPNIPISPRIALMCGLLLTAIGSGGIKPCVSAFGGDQFKLPEQAAQFARFFSMFYFAINAGSLISTTLTPVLRADVHCFGEDSCFPLAFGVPAMLMLISIVLFVIGKPSYTYVKISTENKLVQVSKCISNAISTKFREGKANPRKNLLDHSVDKYGQELVNDIRVLKRILVLYLPLPFFWALYDQQGSNWTLQAELMNGDLGFYNMKPDQMQMVNPLLILVFIPLFEAAVYPLLSKIGIRRPLQRLTLGGILAGTAFLCSALVQYKIESSPKNTVNMLWLVPQYVIITMGEVMFSVTGLEFSYKQAPESMKTVVTAFWQLTVAFGNVIFILIAELQFFESKAHEYLLFASLMLTDMLIFTILAYNYKSNDQTEKEPKIVLEKQEIPLKPFEEKTSI